MSRNENTLRAYRNAIARLVEGAENLAQIKREPPRLVDMFNVIALRSPRVAKSTVNVEIFALRDFLKNGQFDPATGSLIPTPGGPLADWILLAPAQDWQELKRLSEYSASQVSAYSHLAIKDLENHPVIQSEEMDGQQIIEKAGLARHHQKKNKSLKDETVVKWEHIKSIEMLLSLSNPYQSITSVDAGKTPEKDGLTRIFTTAIWATGMRPIELWSSIVMAPRIERPMTHEIRTMIREDPRRAIDEGHMIPVERLSRTPSERLGHALLRAISQAEAPAVLAIKSAKQTNANQEIATPIRLQILEGPPIEIADMICLASQLRYFKAPLERQEAIRKIINRNLSRISDGEPSLSGVRPTLYAFRHAFATRVKGRYEFWEAAALIGHTAAKSTYGYGKRYDPKKNKGRGSGGSWMPDPDPVQAERIRQFWSAETRPDKRPEIN